MSTTLTTLRSKTRYYLDDADSVNWGNTVIDTYINDAQRALWNTLVKQNDSFAMREATATLVDGQSSYPYPTDILGRSIRAMYAYSASTSDWYRVDQASIEEVVAEGTTEASYPYKFACLDGYFMVGPPPDDSGYTIRLFYNRQPTTLSGGTDTMDSDDEFAEIIAIDAAIRAMIPKGGDMTTLVAKKNELLQEAIRASMPDALVQAKNVWNYYP